MNRLPTDAEREQQVLSFEATIIARDLRSVQHALNAANATAKRLRARRAALRDELARLRQLSSNERSPE